MSSINSKNGMKKIISSKLFFFGFELITYNLQPYV